MFNLDTTPVLSESTLALVDELRSIRESVKSLKEREDRIRSALLDELKESDGGITAAGVQVVTIERQPRTRVDSNRLQALHHAAWKDCQVETVVHVIRLPELP